MFEKIKKYIKKGVKVLVGIVAVIMMINTVKNCNSGRNNSAAICASAEEIDVPDIMDGTIEDYDIENYPTANYFDVTVIPEFGTYDYGTTIERSNGLINSIVITTTTAGHANAYVRSYKKLSEYCPEMKVGETYTLTAKTESNAADCITLSGSYIEWYFGYAKTITQEMLDSYIAYWGYSGAEYNGIGCTISEIMINKGTTAYPYTPYYKTLYNAGYTDGEKTGYDSGIIKGQSIAQNGIFADATLNGYLKDELREETVNVGPYYNFKYISGGIDFSQFIPNFETIAQNKWGVDFSDNWETTYLTINLKDNVAISNLKLLGQGYSMFFTGPFTGTDTEGNIYNINWIDDGIYNSVIQEELKNQNILISKISFTFPKNSDGLDVTIYQEGIGYEAGFANGYNQGKDEGYYSGYNIGNKQGYDSGYGEGQAAGETIGYDKAVNEGMSGTGLLFGIFSFIKVFFKLMTQLLSVKVAGDMTVALFVIGIPAAGMIINWVIRLVQNLATGGNGGGNSE